QKSKIPIPSSLYTSKKQELLGSSILAYTSNPNTLNETPKCDYFSTKWSRACRDNLKEQPEYLINSKRQKLNNQHGLTNFFQQKTFLYSLYDFSTNSYMDEFLAKKIDTVLAKTQKRWNEQLQNTINDHFGKLKQVGLIDSPNSQSIEKEQSNRLTLATICLTSEMKDIIVQDNYQSTPTLNNIITNPTLPGNTMCINNELSIMKNKANKYRLSSYNFQHIAQYKLSRNMMTQQIQILLQIESSKFNIELVIDIRAFRALTNQHPNHPFIEYLIKEISKGFRFNFSEKHIKRVQENLKLIEPNTMAFRKYIQDKIEKGRMCRPFPKD
ncbi:22674_t:CDS:2, partial [Dentiscutata erythropus]